MLNLFLYFLAFAFAFLLTFTAMPLLRGTLGGKLKDTPTTLKNHTGIIPLTGGAAIAFGFALSLILIRFLTDFPTGTLRNLRGLFIGGALVFIGGIFDDLKKPAGISPYTKLLFQAAAALILIHYGVCVQFLPPPFNHIITVLWVVGLTNAFNLIDIMDGLAVSQAALAALAFGLIALPSEFIYVNFAAFALLGACLAFWPYNHSNTKKTFLGDSGSNLLGFLLAAVALGTNYSSVNSMAVFVPLLILAVPLFDTAFVSVIRIAKGISPLKGTPDHYPLRLMRMGFKKPLILLLSIIAALLYDALAFFITKTTGGISLAIYLTVLSALLGLALWLKLKTK